MSFYEFRSRPRKSVEVFPSFYCTDSMSHSKAIKEYGMKFTSIVIACSENDFSALIETKEEYYKLGKLLLEKFLEEPNYLRNLIKWSEENKYILRDYLEVELNNLNKLSNEQLANIYQKYVDLYREYHFKNTPAWWVGSEAAEIELKSYLDEKDKSDLINPLTECLEYLSENMQEEFDLLKIAGLSQFKKLLVKHIRDYKHLPFGYNSGILWNERDFLERLNEIKSPKALLKEKKEALLEKKIKRDLLIKQLPIKMQKVVKIIHQLTYLQDLKKSTQTASHPDLQLRLNPEVAKRLKLDLELYLMT